MYEESTVHHRSCLWESWTSTGVSGLVLFAKLRREGAKYKPELASDLSAWPRAGPARTDAVCPLDLDRASVLRRRRNTKKLHVLVPDFGARKRQRFWSFLSSSICQVRPESGTTFWPQNSQKNLPHKIQFPYAPEAKNSETRCSISGDEKDLWNIWNALPCNTSYRLMTR